MVITRFDQMKRKKTDPLIMDGSKYKKPDLNRRIVSCASLWII